MIFIIIFKAICYSYKAICYIHNQNPRVQIKSNVKVLLRKFSSFLGGPESITPPLPPFNGQMPKMLTMEESPIFECNFVAKG